MTDTNTPTIDPIAASGAAFYREALALFLQPELAGIIAVHAKFQGFLEELPGILVDDQGADGGIIVTSVTVIDPEKLLLDFLVAENIAATSFTAAKAEAKRIIDKVYDALGYDTITRKSALAKHLVDQLVGTEGSELIKSAAGLDVAARLIVIRTGMIADHDFIDFLLGSHVPVTVAEAISKIAGIDLNSDALATA